MFCQPKEPSTQAPPVRDLGCLYNRGASRARPPLPREGPTRDKWRARRTAGRRARPRSLAPGPRLGLSLQHQVPDTTRIFSSPPCSPREPAQSSKERPAPKYLTECVHRGPGSQRRTTRPSPPPGRSALHGASPSHTCSRSSRMLGPGTARLPEARGPTGGHTGPGPAGGHDMPACLPTAPHTCPLLRGAPPALSPGHRSLSAGLWQSPVDFHTEPSGNHPRHDCIRPCAPRPTSPSTHCPLPRRGPSSPAH